MRLPSNLLEILQRGEAVLVTGSRLSALAGRPTWPALLARLTSDLTAEDAQPVRALLEREDWSLALSALRERLGPEQAAQLVASAEGERGRPVPPLFGALCRVPWRAVMTTSIGDAWEQALVGAAEPPTVLSAGSSLEADGGTGQILIHVFGRAVAPETLCLSPVDLHAKVMATGLEELLGDLAGNFSFVFVGFEAGDPDLEWLAGRLLGKVLGQQPHFILHTSETPLKAALLRSSYGLEAIATEGALEGALEQLARLALVASGQAPQGLNEGATHTPAELDAAVAADDVAATAPAVEADEAPAAVLAVSAPAPADLAGEAPASSTVSDVAKEVAHFAPASAAAAEAAHAEPTSWVSGTTPAPPEVEAGADASASPVPAEGGEAPAAIAATTSAEAAIAFDAPAALAPSATPALAAAPSDETSARPPRISASVIPILGDAGAGAAERRRWTMPNLAAVDDERESTARQARETERERVAELEAREAARAAREARQAEAALRRQMIEELEGHTDGQRWSEAATVLERLLSLEQDRRARARYLHAQALVHRNGTGDRAGTLSLLERALEEDADLGAAWDSLERLHREAGDGGALRRCYLRRLKHLGATDRAASARLFARVADSARKDLGDRTTAAAALEAVRALDPAEADDRDRELSQLYVEIGPSAADKAIAAHQALVARAPDRVAPYRVLARLWNERGAADRSAFAAAALEHLGLTGGDKARGTKPARAGGAPVKLGRLTDAIIQGVAHPAEDPLLTEIFALVGPPLAALCARPRQSFRAERGEPVRLSKQHEPGRRPSRSSGGAAEWFPALAVAYAADALAVAAPDLYLADPGAKRVAVESLSDGPRFAPALVLDKTFGSNGSEAEIIFAVSHTLALLRPPTLLRFALPSMGHVALALQVGQALAKIPAPPVAAERDVRKAAARVRRLLDAPALTRVTDLARSIASRAQAPDVGRWMAASDLTAARVALILTGDLSAALAAIERDKTTPGALPASERIKDLLAFAVSEQHFQARRALGLDGPADAAGSTSAEPAPVN